MTSTETSGPDWRECRIALPSSENWLVLDLGTEQPEVWARSVVEERLGTGAPSARSEVIIENVLWYWASAVQQQALCAALLVPSDGSVIASCSVRELRVPPEALTLEALRVEAEQAAGPCFGQPEISEIQLPLGPALRVHRREPSAPESDSGAVVEGVAHYILPRAYPAVLECRLLWGSLGLGEELARMADDLAGSVRLV
ncbi:hypothetical protein ACIP79_16100 [Streptomyces sp. NPDC088747]|uniref:hypothetical protein n=1 Tax=Streptomyces sp. NPDC088747 TaxID=3365886 RepID=UPI0038026E5C